MVAALKALSEDGERHANPQDRQHDQEIHNAIAKPPPNALKISMPRSKVLRADERGGSKNATVSRWRFKKS